MAVSASSVATRRALPGFLTISLIFVGTAVPIDAADDGLIR